MIQPAAIAFPEPPAAPARPAPKRANVNAADTREFDELLDDHAEPKAERPGDLADIATVATKAAEAPDDEAETTPVDEEADAPTTPETVDATVLSSQLAMWQILPPPRAEVSVGGEKIAAPIAVENGAEIPGMPSSAGGEKISIPAPPTSPAEGDATPLTAPNAAATAAVATPADDQRGDALPKVAGTPAMAAPVDSVNPLAPIANPLGEKVSQEVANAFSKGHPATNGIPVAKQQRVMSDADLHLSATPATAGFAAPNLAVSPAAAVMPIAAADGQNLHDQPRDETGGQADSALAAAAMLGKENQPHRLTDAPDFPAAVQAMDTTKVIDQIERAVERMRTQGQQRIELRLPTQDGGEILVRLQMEAGQVKAVFRTESDGLRDALEAGWNQFAASAPERAQKVSSVVFEAPTTQSGMGGFNQTSDQRGRQQAFAEAEGRVNAPASTFPTTKITPLATRSPVATAVGLQIYA